MRIKRLGFTSFKITAGDTDIITDPLLAEEAGISLSKITGDVVLLSDLDHSGKEGVLEENGFNKITSTKDHEVLEITGAGEYEAGGVLIRRDLGSDFYIVDEGHVRLMYMGKLSKKIELDDFSELGDIDVLMIPVGDTEIFPQYDKLEKIISKIDPTYLIPCGYLEEGLKDGYKDLKSVDDFIKHFGYTHVTRDKKFNITSGLEPDNKVIEIVVLE
jgi:L-ascorbate metabolism protein UlaG (beta-lactamase superfamily)